MDAITTLRQQYKGAHDLLENTMADVTAEQAHWSPPGTANPLGASYFHAILAEDAMLNGMAKGGQPLIASTFASKMGVSEPPPPPGQSWDEWGRNVKVDLAQTREYAKAVFASVDEYLGTLKETDLDREIDLSMFQMGKQPLSTLVSGIVLQHTNNHLGEISCLKGIQGSKGYPF